MIRQLKLRDVRDPALLVLLHLLLAALAFQPVPHPGGDNAVYVGVAKSILAGSYRDIFDPAAPLHVVYPPGFPIITALGLAVGLKPWVGLKLITIAFSAAMVFFTWLLAKREGSALALVVAGLLAISPGVLALSHWELSDVPFTAMTIAAIILWRRAESGGSRAVVAATLLTLATYSLRSAGLALIVAAGVWLLLHKRWKDSAILAAIIVPPMVVWSVFTRGQEGYFGQLMAADAYAPGRSVGAGGLVTRVLENAEVYTDRFLPVLMSGRYPSWMLLLAVPAIALATYEWIMRLRSSERSVADFFIPLYAGMILLWLPQFSGERLLLPLYPLILLYAALGVRRFADGMAKLPRRAVFVGVPLVFVLAAAPGVKDDVVGGMECTARYREGDSFPCVTLGWQDFFVASQLTATMLPDNSVVLSRKPAILFALSGNRGRLYPYTRDPAVLIDSARVIGARYVIVDQIDELATRYIVPAVLRRPGAFCVMRTFGSERASIFGIMPNAHQIPDARSDPGAAYLEVLFQNCGPDFFREGAYVVPVQPAG